MPTSPRQATDYTRMMEFVSQFTSSRSLSEVSGEAFGLPPTTVYHTATHPLPGKGRIEVNLTTPDTPDNFEWLAELTIDNRAAAQFIHLIARRDQTIVETYGKNVIEISPARAKAIMKLLTDLMA
jgi:hypothetical protein